MILNPGPMQASAFSELDRLNAQILSTYDDSKVLVDVLGVVLALEHLDFYAFAVGYGYATNVKVIADIAGLGEDKVQLVLRALQSVTTIQIEPLYDDWDNMQPSGAINQRVQHSHRSFYDFLTDEARSRSHFINIDLFIGRIFCRMFELATASMKFFRR